MASLARTVASLQTRLSIDVNRESPLAPHLGESAMSRDRCSSSLPSSTSFSDFSMSVGDEVAMMYDGNVDDGGNALGKDVFAMQDGFPDDGSSVPASSFMSMHGGAPSEHAQAAHALHHTMSMPAPGARGQRVPVAYMRGSAHSRSAPVAIPKANVEGLNTRHASLDLEDADGIDNTVSAPLPQQPRSLYALMTTPRPTKQPANGPRDYTLDYYEFAEMMRSF